MYSRPFSGLGTAEVFFFLKTTRLRIVGLSDEISIKRIAYGVNDFFSFDHIQNVKRPNDGRRMMPFVASVP